MLKRKDVDFIKQLRKNSRLTLTQISRKTHIPISTLYDRLKNHEKDFITKHTTLVDFSKIGYNAKAQMFFKVPLDRRKQLELFLKNHGNINSIYLLSNDYDFSVEGIFENIQQVREFTDYIDENFKLDKQEVVFVAKDIVKEGFLAG